MLTDRFDNEINSGCLIVYDDEVYLVTEIKKSHINARRIFFSYNWKTKSTTDWDIADKDSRLKSKRTPIVLGEVKYGKAIKERARLEGIIC